MNVYNIAVALGFSFISYSFGRLISNLCLFREDSGKQSFLDTALSFISIIFMLCGVFAAIIAHLIFSFPNKRAEKLIRKEEREKASELEKAAVRSAVSLEHDRLISFYLEEMHKQRDKIRAEESEKYRERLHEILDKRKAEE